MVLKRFWVIGRDSPDEEHCAFSINTCCWFKIFIMKNTFLSTLLIAFLSQLSFAQTFDKTKLDQYFDALETNNKFMGSVAVSKDGKVIYSKTIGYADIENKLKANENSKYRIGSISKTFTTVMVLKAVEENILDINQTIDNYFPSIKNCQSITVEHLLSHRSGIHNFTDDESYLTYNTEAKTEKEMLEIIAKGGSDFEPDSKAEYSNSNFVLLSYILEKTYKKPYADILQESIIQPLELKYTSLGGTINSKENECKSYTYLGAWKIQPETDMSIPLGAGSIISTPSDLTQFSDALFGGQILKASSLELMKTLNDGYGMGLFQVPFNDKKGYGHTGGIDGFSSVFYHFSDGNISYALTSNGANFKNNDISIAVLSAVYNQAYSIPEFTNFQVTSQDLDKYLGVYVSSELPIKITITKDKTTLIAQATGQSAFSLEATAKDKFKFEQAGVIIEFNPEENTMLLKQVGGKFTFTKE